MDYSCWKGSTTESTHGDSEFLASKVPWRAGGVKWNDTVLATQLHHIFQWIHNVIHSLTHLLDFQDRKVVEECIRLWFGDQRGFEASIQTEVVEAAEVSMQDQ